MAQSNAEIARQAYEAFARGDVQAVLAVFDENISWRIPGEHLVSGDYHGHAEVSGFFEQLGELSDGTFTVDVHDLLESDSGAVAALTTINAVRKNENGSFETVQVWQFSDGRATSFHEYHDRQADLNAFWS